MADRKCCYTMRKGFTLHHYIRTNAYTCLYAIDITTSISMMVEDKYEHVNVINNAGAKWNHLELRSRKFQRAASHLEVISAFGFAFFVFTTFCVQTAPSRKFLLSLTGCLFPRFVIEVLLYLLLFCTATGWTAPDVAVQFLFPKRRSMTSQRLHRSLIDLTFAFSALISRCDRKKSTCY